MTEEGDEGRDKAPISSGKLLVNVIPGDLRMGKPHEANPHDSALNRRREHTLGSETSQYQQEKKTNVTPLVAASETGRAQTQPQNLNSWDPQGQTLGSLKVRPCMNLNFGDGGYKATACVLDTRRVTNRLVRRSAWEGALQRVIAPYSKTKRLYGCSS